MFRSDLFTRNGHILGILSACMGTLKLRYIILIASLHSAYYTFASKTSVVFFQTILFLMYFYYHTIVYDLNKINK